MFPPPPKRKVRKLSPPPRVSISILDYAPMPTAPGQYHFNFEFHCSDCGGYVLDIPENDDLLVRCKACGAAFDTLADIKDACRKIALAELKSKKLGAFREDV